VSATEISNTVGMRDRADSKPTLLQADRTQAILGAFYHVYDRFGAGFLEAVYANALAVVLRRAGHRVEREVPFEIVFLGERIGFYRADFVVDAAVIVEVKARRTIDPASSAQLLNYLRASNLEVGLLLNFGPKAEFKRVVSTPRRR
jgi:GxxExxY protein